MSTQESAELLQTLMTTLIVSGILFYAINAFLLSKVFAKTGIEPWKAWVPLYSEWKFFELGGQKPALSLTYLLAGIPLIGLIPIIYSVIAAHQIGLGFGKSKAWAVLYLFLKPVWYGLIGFGSAQYNGSYQGQVNQEEYASQSNERIEDDNSNYNAQPQQQFNSYDQPAQGYQQQSAPIQKPSSPFPVGQPAQPQQYNAPAVPNIQVPRSPQLGSAPLPNTPKREAGFGGFAPPVLPPRFPPLPPTPKRNPPKE